MKSEARMTGQPLLNRCEKLNRFLKIPGAPLDNNVCERALKRGVFNRKNSTKQPGGGCFLRSRLALLDQDLTPRDPTRSRARPPNPVERRAGHG